MEGVTRITTGTGGTNPKKFSRATLSGTVTANDVLMLDRSKTGPTRFVTMKRAAAGVALGHPWAAAVALEDGVEGDVIEIQVEGVHATVKSSGLAADDVCVVDATEASLEDYVPADHNAPPFAIALAATSGGFTEVYLLNPLKL